MRKNILVIGHSNTCDRTPASELPIFANASKMFLYKENPNWIAQTYPSPPYPSPPPYILNAQGSWDQAVAEVEPAGSVAGSAGAFQLAMANKLAGLLDVEIGLVPHAMGGLSIDAWAKWSRNTGFYGLALQRVEWAEDLGHLSAVVIWIGENDLSTTTQAATLSQKITNLISNIRVDVGNLDLPVIVIKYGDLNSLGLVGWNEGRKQFDWIAQRKVRVVTTDEINPTNGVHFNTAGYVQIGEKVADALATMI